MPISSHEKKTPFEVVVLCGVLDNENGVIRKFHPGLKEPTILRVPQDLSYRNAGIHIGERRMAWRDPVKYPVRAAVPPRVSERK